MMSVIVLFAAAMVTPISLADKSAQRPSPQFYQANKVKLDALLALLPPEIIGDIKRRKRTDDMAGLPLPLPPRLNPPPYIFVLPATTGGSNYNYVAQLETDRDKMALTTPKQPDYICKSCPISLDKTKQLSPNMVMSCCGALLEPVDPFPNVRKDVKKRVNFGNVYSYKWEKKRQSNGRTSRKSILEEVAKKGRPKKRETHV